MPRTRIPVLLVALALCAGASVAATTIVQRLAQNRYLIIHQKETTLGGSKGGVVSVATNKAATLCTLLGFTHFSIGIDGRRGNRVRVEGWNCGG